MHLDNVQFEHLTHLFREVASRSLAELRRKISEATKACRIFWNYSVITYDFSYYESFNILGGQPFVPTQFVQLFQHSKDPIKI